MGMSNRYKRVMLVSGIGMAVALIFGITTRLMGVDPMPGVTGFGMLCAVVFVAVPIVWANVVVRRQGRQ